MASEKKNLGFKSKINPSRYAYYGRIELSKISRAEYRRFIKHIISLPQFYGEGERTVFFKIADMIPNNEEEVLNCKEFNEIKGRQIMSNLLNAINKLGNFSAKWTD
jgi:DNA-directed RNA polymerase subunit F